MKKETANGYMRNSHNDLNESGNQIKGARNVNIAHMDAKVLLEMWMASFVALLLLVFFGFAFLEFQVVNTNQTLNQIQIELAKLKNS